MTQENRELLLKDLCARLPYGVKCINIRWPRDGHVEISNINTNSQKVQIFEDWCDINDCKPYLRSLSSMTNEEKNELWELLKKLGMTADAKRLDWLNKKMFDYRGLIPKGLALEAPEGMYK